MSELFNKTEDISNGMVDIYRGLQGKSKLDNSIALLLVMCPLEIQKTVSRFEREKILTTHNKTRNEIVNALDKGVFLIKTLLLSKLITREQAKPILDDLEMLNELISINKKKQNYI